MKNSPERVLIDSSDAKVPLSPPGVDRNEVREYFVGHGLLELFDASEGDPDLIDFSTVPTSADDVEMLSAVRRVERLAPRQ